MSILLIRHGETASNAARIVQTMETPLSPRGHCQAKRLARRLADLGVARILSSDLARASMTAECLQAATGAPLEIDALLRERDYGEIRGRPYATLEVDLFSPDYAPPGGETWEVFHVRVDRAWSRVEAMAADASGHLAVVTHGLVCHSVISRLVRVSDPDALPLADGSPLYFGNTALTILEGPPPLTLTRLACTEHLDATDADPADAVSAR